jgi:uncharacterized repeat protein (TIGR03803 family)
LTLIGSTLYGTTYEGGASGGGTVFSVPVGGGTPTALGSFNGSSGGCPKGSLTLIGSTLYGTAYAGGASNDGTVFGIPVGGGTPTALGSFNGSNGVAPCGSLTLSADGSTLYGTAEGGGASGYGTVFSIPVGGGTPTALGSFNGKGNGAYPGGGLTLIGSTLYGTTEEAGGGGYGTVFSIPVSGGTPTALGSFNSSDGAYPCGGLTLSADGSTFYGTACYRGANLDGAVFSIPVGGGTPTALTSFNGSDGVCPMGDLALSADGSTLYGTTEYGGDTNSGTVFALTLPTPEPSTFALLGVGAIGLVAYGWRRRAARRTAQPEPQDDDPATLSFPSQSPRHSARRAA